MSARLVSFFVNESGLQSRKLLLQNLVDNSSLLANQKCGKEKATNCFLQVYHFKAFKFRFVSLIQSAQIVKAIRAAFILFVAVADQPRFVEMPFVVGIYRLVDISWRFELAKLFYWRYCVFFLNLNSNCVVRIGCPVKIVDSHLYLPILPLFGHQKMAEIRITSIMLQVIRVYC